jgi:hypothetical protein
MDPSSLALVEREKLLEAAGCLKNVRPVGLSLIIDVRHAGRQRPSIKGPCGGTFGESRKTAARKEQQW